MEGSMQFGILGPLDVRRDGVPVAAGGPKQRALLALLLLSANKVVSRDRLIEELWSGQPADTGAHSLDVTVSRLRNRAAAQRRTPRCGVSLAGHQRVSGPKSTAFERGSACPRQYSHSWRWFGTSHSQFVSDRDHARALDGRVAPEAAVRVGGDRTQHIGISL
jgi:hypothetical protein